MPLAFCIEIIPSSSTELNHRATNEIPLPQLPGLAVTVITSLFHSKETTPLEPTRGNWQIAKLNHKHIVCAKHFENWVARLALSPVPQESQILDE